MSIYIGNKELEKKLDEMLEENTFFSRCLGVCKAY